VGGGGGGDGGSTPGTTPADPPSSGGTFSFVLRISGTPWNYALFRVYENGQEFANAYLTRQTGDPDDQNVTIGPYFLDPANRNYTVYLEKDGKGANPIWFSLAVNGGSWAHITTLNQNNPIDVVDITSLLAGRM